MADHPLGGRRRPGLERPAPKARLLSFGENAIEYELVGRLDATDVELPLPHRTDHLTSDAVADDTAGSGVVSRIPRTAVRRPTRGANRRWARRLK